MDKSINEKLEVLKDIILKDDKLSDYVIRQFMNKDRYSAYSRNRFKKLPVMQKNITNLLKKIDITKIDALIGLFDNCNKMIELKHKQIELYNKMKVSVLREFTK